MFYNIQNIIRKYKGILIAMVIKTLIFNSKILELIKKIIILKKKT